MGKGGWAEKEKKLSLFLGPPAGVLSRRQSVQREGLCPPFAQRSLPAQAWRWEICSSWPRRRPFNGYCERESGIGDLGVRVPSVDEAQASRSKVFPSSLGVKDRPKKVFGMGLHGGLVGGTQPFLVYLATLYDEKGIKPPVNFPLAEIRNFCFQPKKPHTVFSPKEDIGRANTEINPP